MAINVGQAEQLRATLNRVAGTFAQYRSQLSALFAKAGGTSTSALMHAAQLCGQWAADLRLRIEYARATDKIKFGRVVNQGVVEQRDWANYSELQTAVGTIGKQLAAAEAARKKQEKKDDGGWLGKAKNLAGKAVDTYTGTFIPGVWEGTKGLLETGWDNGKAAASINPVIGPAWAVVDYDSWKKHGWANKYGEIKKTVGYAWDHPGEFGKTIVDWETWKKDPIRAWGKLTPDIVLAAATFGTGTAATASTRAASTATKTSKLSQQAEKPAVPSKAGHDFSGGRMRPRDVLDIPSQRKWARQAYEDFRSNERDIDAITNHLKNSPESREAPFTRSEIAEIKEHVFRRSHLIEDYDTGKLVRRRFDADEHMASAWIRLRSGRGLPQDIQLLRHELAELGYLKKNPTAPYREAHLHANMKYNWEDMELPKQLEDIDADW